MQFLTGYLEKNQRNSGSLEIYYEFTGMSGLFVPNQLYQGQTQFYNIPGGFGVNGQYSPGIFSSSYQESGFTGSGVFDGITNLRVINQLTGDSISLFYNFSSYSCAKSFNIGSKSCAFLRDISPAKLRPPCWNFLSIIVRPVRMF